MSNVRYFEPVLPLNDGELYEMVGRITIAELGKEGFAYLDKDSGKAFHLFCFGSVRDNINISPYNNLIMVSYYSSLELSIRLLKTKLSRLLKMGLEEVTGEVEV